MSLAIELKVYLNMSHRTVRCHNCKRTGHYSDRCPYPPAPSKKAAIKCHACGVLGHYSDKCPTSIDYTAPRLQDQTSNSNSSRSIPSPLITSKLYQLDLKFDGRWTKTGKSAFIHPQCAIFKVKRAFADKLFSCGYINDSMMDSRNSIPHCELWNISEESGDKAYTDLDGRVLEVNINAFRIRNDFVDLNIGMGRQ